jgi:hypothetical protein
MKKLVFALFAFALVFQVSAMACGLDGDHSKTEETVEETT